MTDMLMLQHRCLCVSSLRGVDACRPGLGPRGTVPSLHTLTSLQGTQGLHGASLCAQCRGTRRCSCRRKSSLALAHCRGFVLQRVLSPSKEDNWGWCSSLLSSPHVGCEPLDATCLTDYARIKPVCFKKTTLLSSVFLSFSLCFYSFQ